MLTERLNCIINYVNNEIVADIGTDHGYVATELIKRGQAKRVIASDVRQGPLNAAIENINKYGMGDVIETRLGSGLSVIKPYESDLAVIAGMGGELIIEIIKEDNETARSMKLVLQPMNAQYELRHFLIENEFMIEKEDIVCEGNRVYNVMIVKNGHMEKFEKEIYYHIPKYLENNPKFYMLSNKKKREFEKIVKGLKNSNNTDIERLEYYSSLLSEMEEYSI